MPAKKEYNESNTLVPLYDNEDAVCGIVYNDVPYYFLKNLQGDIIAITDANATVVARYTYDAWGVPTVAQDLTSVGIATINPFRYRGYYYDAEIGMYYLQSRYYDPVVGRYVNADEVSFVGMNDERPNTVNLFVYCNNAVTMLQDFTGNIPIDLIIGAIYGAILGLFGYLLDISFDFLLEVIFRREKFSKYLKYVGKNIVWWKLLLSVVIGAACGALATTNKAKLISTIVNLISSIYSAVTSGTSFLLSIAIGIITFIIQELMKSARSFSKFNFKKIGNQTSKTFSNMSKKNISKLKTIITDTITHYIKSNKKLYKQCFGTFTKYTASQWGVIWGCKTVDKVSSLSGG